MDPRLVPAWSTDWAWGLPLIVFTVVLHGYGLGLLSKEVNFRLSSREELRHPSYISIYVIGGTALSATMLHGIEAFIWGCAYRLLGASPDFKSAMLYSLNAMTSYGHTNLYFGAKLANVRRPGSLERLDSVWSHHGISFLSSSESVAAYLRGPYLRSLIIRAVRGKSRCA
jgi:hypothetical protein